MDFSFHLQQGHQLLQKQNSESMKKALQHFKSANELTEETHPGKPKILYSLALGNILIGNVKQGYLLVHKAKKGIDIAINNSMIRMDNMRQMYGETDIDSLIQYINENYFHIVSNINLNAAFNENELDFSMVEKIYPTVTQEKIVPQFSIDQDLLMATFAGMARTKEELVYFDKLKGDVLSYVEGYFSSLLGDQSLSNRMLANRITSGAQKDFVDENRYILIDRLILADFLAEYIIQTQGIEPFYSYVEYFSDEILDEFSFNPNLTTRELTFSNHIQEKFHQKFGEKYNGRFDLKENYTRIFEKTCDNISLDWIQKKILN